MAKAKNTFISDSSTKVALQQGKSLGYEPPEKVRL